MRKLLFYIVLWLCMPVFAQKISVKTSANSFKIGDQINYTISVSNFQGKKIVFPTLDSIGKMEVVAQPKEIAIKNNNQITYNKTYVITHFDAGEFTIPKVPVFLEKDTIFTETKNIVVLDVTVDTLKQKMYGIKKDIPIQEENQYKNNELTTKTLLLWLFGSFFLALLGYFVLKRFQKITLQNQQYIPPFEKINTVLIYLESPNIPQKNKYTEITNAIKKYFQTTLEIPTLESTTEVFFKRIQNTITAQKLSINNQYIDMLQKVFANADLVKFANTNVSEKVWEKDYYSVKENIEKINNSLPTSNEEKRVLQAKNEIEAKRKKQSITRQLLAVFIFAFGIILGAVSIGFTPIKEYYNVMLHGKNALYYNNKNWKNSMYGYPVLSVETPEILTRNLKKQTNDISVFSWQTANDPISISINTIQYKDSAQQLLLLNLFNKELKVLKTQIKASNIVTTANKFNNKPKNITGDVFAGTFDYKVADKNTKKGFKSLYLQDKKGLHHIQVIYNIEDKNIEPFLERLFNSAEVLKEEEDE
jgi:hypothetical protein